MTTDHRITFRLEPIDAANVAAIAAKMQADTGRVFVSRTDVLRHALRTAAVEAAKAKTTAAA